MTFRPIFISGCDCSGAESLGRLLGLSDWVVNPPQASFLQAFAVQSQLGAFTDPNKVIEWLRRQPGYIPWKLGTKEQDFSLLIDLQNERRTIENLVKIYLATHYPQKTGADVWVDHTTHSFRYYSTLKALFPEARFIHLIRDGRVLASSLCRKPWGPNNAYTVSKYWADCVESGLGIERVEGNNCLRVRFEDLTAARDETLAAICDFIDVPYTQDMSHESTETQASNARHQVKSFSSNEIRDFESHPFSHLLLTHLGYQPKNIRIPDTSTPWKLKNHVHDFILGLKNRFETKQAERTHVREYREFATACSIPNQQKDFKPLESTYRQKASWEHS